MDQRPDPLPPPRNDGVEERARAWLELKREMEVLHARVEYLRLMLKLGVRVP